MKIQQAKLVISAVHPRQYPQDELKEIALAGRSNVGKSSLINRIINRKGLARTSSQPGKTQTLNFYQLNNAFRIVDVPGYGYAKVSKTERDKWSAMIDTYLKERQNLELLLILMDFRHAPSELDIAMKNYADELELPYAIVLTKIDKIKRGQWNKHLNEFARKLDVPTEAFYLFSAETAEGAEDLQDLIAD